jgi:hypothetical protein
VAGNYLGTFILGWDKDAALSRPTYPDATCDITTLSYFGNLRYYTSQYLIVETLLIVADAGDIFEAETTSTMTGADQCSVWSLSLSRTSDDF